MEEQPWKNLKLSLERPYKDDKGEPIPALLDIHPDGTHVYEPKEDPSKKLGQNLRRIFLERGLDFFDSDNRPNLQEESSTPSEKEDGAEGPEERSQDISKPTMTPEELFQMRTEIMPQLYIALGEMSHAKELLSLLLASTNPSEPSPVPSLPPATLAATMVAKPAPIISVQAFDVQLNTGGKDEALRKAADLFKSAANSLENGRLRGEKYWLDALRIRRANWGLAPAPLPFGAPTGKGVDRTSKDFLISFGLEGSTAYFRRKAIGHMPTDPTTLDPLVFPHRQRTRLYISLNMVDAKGAQVESHNSIVASDDTSLEGSLAASQREIVEEEIFSTLIKEASSLPTASARVAERLIDIDAAQGMELRFELRDSDVIQESLQSNSSQVAATMCDLIYSLLCALLLGMHTHKKLQRIGHAGVAHILPQGSPSYTLLQPIIDLLQYQVFCERIRTELEKMVRALSKAEIPCNLRFDPIGESGEQLVRLFTGEDLNKKIGGEAILRIDSRHTLRLTLQSPSSLTAHLPQATLSIASIPQLVQLLSDEVEQCLLNKICEVGRQICEHVHGTWFVDMVSSRAVGRWEGCVLNFCIVYGKDYAIHSTAFRLRRVADQRPSLIETYTPDLSIPLVTWLRSIIAKTSLET